MHCACTCTCTCRNSHTFESMYCMYMYVAILSPVFGKNPLCRDIQVSGVELLFLHDVLGDVGPKLLQFVLFRRSKELTQFNVSTTLRSCLYWDEDEEEWSGEGCVVGNLTTTETLHCSCTHLSAFAGGVVVTPNTIEFSPDAIHFTRYVVHVQPTPGIHNAIYDKCLFISQVSTRIRWD